VRRQGATHLEFVFPCGLSVITPDALAIFRNAPHRPVAEAFVDFVLSESGQRLWYQKRGTPGGPPDFDLERLPVQPRLYALGLPTYTVARPFAEGSTCAYDGRKGGRRWSMLEHILRAVFMNPHEELSGAWVAAIRAGRTEDLGAALGRPPVTEEQLLALGDAKPPAAEMNALRNRWTGWARARFAALRAAAESGGPVPEYVPGPVR
jgi:ABC-type glycerol-3-phosphate transport system substrate-binding protein